MKTVLSLASTSPRRRELLAFGGWMFHLLPVEVDESVLPGEPALDYVLRMAENKARAAAGHLRPGGIAVSADTTVADGDQILGKPSDPNEAAGMLQQLRGRSHKVHTAVAVIKYGGQAPHTEVCTTEVPMRSYSDEEITAYIATRDPFDKAGGYAIQHQGFSPVEALSGCYANVVGLPVCHLARLLRTFNLPASSEVPKHCLEKLGYDCDVYESILAGEM